jgi:hypothetical protein
MRACILLGFLASLVLSKASTLTELNQPTISVTINGKRYYLSLWDSSSVLIFGQARTLFHALVLVAVLAPEAVPVILP